MIKLLYVTVLVFLFCLKIQAQAVNEKLSIKLENATVLQLIDELEKKTTFRFYYLPTWLDSIQVNVNATESTIETILKEAFNNTPLQFYIYQQRIILTDNTPIIPGMDPLFFINSKSDTTTTTNYSFKREYIADILASKKEGKTIVEIGAKQATTTGKSTLVGYVKEAKSSEALAGAAIYIEELAKGTSTNAAGYYSFTLPQGLYTLIVKYAGMVTERKKVIFYSEGKLDFNLTEDVISLQELVVESERDANSNTNQMGKSSLDMKSIKNVPKVLGENDILRVVLTLPGVKTVGEASSGINVRGGNADQNLMLLNEATIYNTSHFLGFFSVFNADVIKSSELYKSGIPAQYGGRLSSIFDVQMKDGNVKKFSGTGGLGPVTTKLTLEVPIFKEKTSLVIGGRTTYSDWLLTQIPSSTIKNSSVSFYDFVGRLTHKFNQGNSLAVSYYYSKDKFKLGNDSLFSYANSLASLQWKSSITRNLQSVMSFTHSEYAYSIDYLKAPKNAFNLGFGIKDTNAKWDFNLYKGSHTIDFGAQSKLYELNPGYINPKGDSSLVQSAHVQPEKGLESALYVADNIDVNSKFSIYLGLRYSSFTTLGARNIYAYQPGKAKDETTVNDSTLYANNKAIKTFQGPEYRVSLRYSLPHKSSIKISYNRTRQYIHMLSNTVSVSPTTTWKLSDPNVLPQLGDQISIGYYKDLSLQNIEVSTEFYYKKLNNVLDYKTGSDLILNQHIEQDVIQGKGLAYGAEFLVKKKSGRLNGWVSYTYSRTFLKMDSPIESEKINNGNYYPASYDKPHDISIVANYKFTRRYSLSANFSYSTGRPITYPIGLYQLAGGYKIDYSDRNQFRIPDYIRVDIGINIEGNHKIKSLAHSFWNISIYNVLGRKNPYSIYFKSENGVIKGYQLSIFGAPIPTITYNFRF